MPDTRIEQTTHKKKATTRVFETVSLDDTALAPPVDVGSNDTEIDQLRKKVGEQNGEHNALGISWIYDSNDYCHKADERSVEPLTGICHR